MFSVPLTILVLAASTPAPPTPSPSASPAYVFEEVPESQWGCQWSERWKHAAARRPSSPLPHKVVERAAGRPQGAQGYRGGVPVVEAVIDERGRVADVRYIRRIHWDAERPDFDRYVFDTVRGWTYTPVELRGHPVPACMTVTINIHWR
jgi:hypothetical protein